MAAIPIFVVLFCIWCVKYISKSVRTGLWKIEESAWEAHKSEFQAQTSLSREQRWEIEKSLENNYSEGRRIIKAFMGDNSDDWNIFAYGTMQPAHMVLAAKLGKLWCNYMGVSSPLSKGMDPPWKALEMMERFMLKIEDELHRHGVHTVLVANYEDAYRYVSVREYVQKNGFGHCNFSTSFNWSNNLLQWKDFDY